MIRWLQIKAFCTGDAELHRAADRIFLMRVVIARAWHVFSDETSFCLSTVNLHSVSSWCHIHCVSRIYLRSTKDSFRRTLSWWLGSLVKCPKSLADKHRSRGFGNARVLGKIIFTNSWCHQDFVKSFRACDCAARDSALRSCSLVRNWEVAFVLLSVFGEPCLTSNDSLRALLVGVCLINCIVTYSWGYEHWL